MCFLVDTMLQKTAKGLLYPKNECPSIHLFKLLFYSSLHTVSTPSGVSFNSLILLASCPKYMSSAFCLMLYSWGHLNKIGPIKNNRLSVQIGNFWNECRKSLERVSISSYYPPSLFLALWAVFSPMPSSAYAAFISLTDCGPSSSISEIISMAVSIFDFCGASSSSTGISSKLSRLSPSKINLTGV